MKQPVRAADPRRLDVAGFARAGGMQLAVKNSLQAQEILAAAGIDSEAVPARRSLEDIFIEMVGADND